MGTRTKGWLILASGANLAGTLPAVFIAAFLDAEEALMELRSHIGVREDDELHHFSTPRSISAEAVCALGLIQGEVRRISSRYAAI